MSQLTRKTVKWARTLHIYISLVGFFMFAFFAITGILLNHDSFGWDRMSTATSRSAIAKDIALAGKQNTVVGALQAALQTTLPATRFSAHPEEIEVAFTGPGHRIQALVNRTSGSVEVTAETRGWAGVLADLHKGAETGAVWKFLLDLISVLLVLSSITGLIILLSLPNRRWLGLLTAALGTVVALVGYVVWVPK